MLYAATQIGFSPKMYSFFVQKNACLKYREFDLDDDPVGVPHTWNLSVQPFITLLKLV